MKKNTIILAAILATLPSLALAQFSNASNLGELLALLTSYAGKVIGLLVTIALVVFFYRIVISIYKVGSDPKAVANGKTLLIWGLVALFVMMSVWGIVSFVGEAFGVSRDGRAVVIPQLETRNR